MNRRAFDRVRLHDLVLGFRQLAGFAQDLVVDTYLPNVVQRCAHSQQVDIFARQVQTARANNKE